jgi:hypothetical protein
MAGRFDHREWLTLDEAAEFLTRRRGPVTPAEIVELAQDRRLRLCVWLEHPVTATRLSSPSPPPEWGGDFPLSSPRAEWGGDWVKVEVEGGLCDLEEGHVAVKSLYHALRKLPRVKVDERSGVIVSQKGTRYRLPIGGITTHKRPGSALPSGAAFVVRPRELLAIEGLLGPEPAHGRDDGSKLPPVPPEVPVTDIDKAQPLNNRAAWLRFRIETTRGETTTQFAKHGGFHRQTIDKILQGIHVQDDVIQRLAIFLKIDSSKIPRD